MADPFADFEGFDDELQTSPASAARSRADQYVERCDKCHGTGQYGRLGQCFACKGTGQRTYRQSWDQRAKARAYAASAKERAAQTWRDTHVEEVAWMTSRAERFAFASGMLEAVAKYGSLTDGQLAAVRRCMARDSERDVQRAQERAQRAASAPAIDLSAIEAAFAKAREAGLRRPSLRLAGFRFSPASAYGKNPGAIYVKDSAGEYLGKVADGKLHRAYACTPEQAEQVVAVAADPEQAAIAYGKRYGQCACCGRELSDPVSVERGIGPVCASKYGW